jgi:acyl carrier protein
MDSLVQQLKTQIIQALKLEGVQPDEIDDHAPLFGEDGLGLDSIDALELAVVLEKHYNIRITDINVGRKAFTSVSTMAAFIRENQ